MLSQTVALIILALIYGIGGITCLAFANNAYMKGQIAPRVKITCYVLLFGTVFITLSIRAFGGYLDTLPPLAGLLFSLGLAVGMGSCVGSLIWAYTLGPRPVVANTTKP